MKNSFNNKVSEFIIRKQTEVNLHNKNLKERTDCEIATQKEIEVLEEVRIILQKVGKSTQNSLSFQIEEIVNLALDAVFEDSNYKFKITFIEKRNRTEAELYVLKNGHRMNPVKANGGGLLDILSFALRISLWTLCKSTPTLIMDEPFKFLSKELQEKAGTLVQTLSDKLKLQFIIVTHEQAIIDCADRIFVVTQTKGVSKVELIKS